MTQVILQGLSLADFYSEVKKIVSESIEESKPKNKIDSEKFLTRAEVAEKLNISLPTLQTYIKLGYVPAYRIGNRVLFKPNEIEKTLSKINVKSRLQSIED